MIKGTTKSFFFDPREKVNGQAKKKEAREGCADQAKQDAKCGVRNK